MSLSSSAADHLPAMDNSMRDLQEYEMDTERTGELLVPGLKVVSVSIAAVGAAPSDSFAHPFPYLPELQHAAG